MAIKVKNIGTTDEYVYDVSADGTVVSALDNIVMSNTDGFDFQLPEKFRYTKENGGYIGKGLNRDTKEGKAYYDAEADVAEFDDMYLNRTYNGSTINRSGLGIDEYVLSSVNLSRKNYFCYMQEDDSIKKVGNTIKSRKMALYMQKFIDKACYMLVKDQGLEFLELYYNMVDDIYNYRIPVKDIASKGNIKKSLDTYKKDCLSKTKSGSKKSRQAWYELAIENKLNVNVGDSIYFINIGENKKESDVKRITHRYIKDQETNEEIELVGKVKTRLIKQYCADNNENYKTISTDKKAKILSQYVVREEDEIIINCKLVPIEIMNSDKEYLCSDIADLEYNVDKYIDQLNRRVMVLLVCFDKSIRDRVLITNPSDRPTWTKEECRLVSGQPLQATDQDSYEALMMPEKKEIAFWDKIGEVPPFVKECGINWDEVLDKYHKDIEKENNELFKAEDKKYLDALAKLKKEDIENFEEDGTLPEAIKKVVTINSSDMRFYFNNIPNTTPSTGGNVFDDISLDHGIEVEETSEVDD